MLAVSCLSSAESDRVEQAVAAISTAEESSPIEDGQAAENVGAGNYSVFRPARVSLDPSSVDWARELRHRMVPATSETPPPARSPSSTDSLRALALSASAPAVMRFHVTLDEPSFDFRTLNTRDEPRRQGLIHQRMEQVRPSQQIAEAAIRSLGGRVVGRLWLANQLMVEAPRSVVPSILNLPGVTAGFEEATVRPGVAYNGDEVRLGTLATSLHAAGFRGNDRSLNGATQRIRIGISEVGRLNTSHVGFLDYFGGPSRIARYALCSGGTCTNQTALPAAGDDHGTWVASAALGSIEELQDSNFYGFGTLSQRQRSGINPEASLYYYQMATSADDPTSIQQAIVDHVDIFSASWTMSCGSWCNPDANCYNINTLFRNGLDAGMLPVVMVGNAGNEPPLCTLSWPGYSPSTIGVAALDSISGTSYGATTRSTFSGRGPVIGALSGGWPVAVGGVDMAAPGIVSNLYTISGSNGYSGDVAGTSIATPIVAGAAGLLRQALNAIGWSGNDARALAVNLLLLGDHSDGTAAGKNLTMDPHMGAGRLRLHWPSDTSMVAPWGWGWRSFTIYNGQTVSWTVGDGGPESSLITRWKWAVMWFENSLTSVADIVIRVVDSCQGNAIIANDVSYYTRKTLFLNGGSQIANRCLVMQVTGVGVPPEGRVIYSADYFQSGDASIH